MSEYVVEVEYDTLNGTFSQKRREEIVRCRDCEYARIMRPLDWRTGKPSTVIEEWYCQWHSNPEGASDIEPDGFCAWGERRDA